MGQAGSQPPLELCFCGKTGSWSSKQQTEQWTSASLPPGSCGLLGRAPLTALSHSPHTRRGEADRPLPSLLIPILQPLLRNTHRSAFLHLPSSQTHGEAGHSLRSNKRTGQEDGAELGGAEVCRGSAGPCWVFPREGNSIYLQGLCCIHSHTQHTHSPLMPTFKIRNMMSVTPFSAQSHLLEDA